MFPYRSLFQGAMLLKENGVDLGLKLPQKNKNSPQKKKETCCNNCGLLHKM